MLLAFFIVNDTGDVDQFCGVMNDGSKMVNFDEFANFVNDSLVLDFLVFSV